MTQTKTNNRRGLSPVLTTAVVPVVMIKNDSYTNAVDRFAQSWDTTALQYEHGHGMGEITYRVATDTRVTRLKTVR